MLLFLSSMLSYSVGAIDSARKNLLRSLSSTRLCSTISYVVSLFARFLYIYELHSSLFFLYFLFSSLFYILCFSHFKKMSPKPDLLNSRNLLWICRHVISGIPPLPGRQMAAASTVASSAGVGVAWWLLLPNSAPDAVTWEASTTERSAQFKPWLLGCTTLLLRTNTRRQTKATPTSRSRSKPSIQTKRQFHWKRRRLKILGHQVGGEASTDLKGWLM